MRTTCKLYVLYLLFGYFCHQGFCARISGQSLNVEYNNYQDDEYDYGDDTDIDALESNEISALNTTLKTTPLPPFFENSEMEINAKPGDDVILNCDVRNFRLGNVIVWYKHDTIIANGQYANDNRKYSVLKNYSIRISNVQASDAGEYYCEVHPEKVRLHVYLHVGRNLSIYCDNRDVTDLSITLREGGEHVFECRIYVPNAVDIKWSLNGERAEMLATKIDGGKMYIDNIDEEFAGIYQCLGDDGSSDPPHGMVTVDIQYSPKVSTHRHHVNTEEGDKAALYCDYKANPIAITRWLKNGMKLSYSEKFSLTNTMHKKHNRTILTVKDVTEADLGQYECYVENTIGANSMKVYLGYEPENPQFEDIKVEGNMVTLHWLVKSLQPLSEAVMDYKMTGAHTWSTVSVFRTQRHTENGIWKITHEIELMPGEWHTRVKTKNTIGWSKFSVQYDFVIKESNEATYIYNEDTAPGDLVMAAGVGLKNAAKALNYKCSVLFTIGLIVFYAS